MIDVLGSVLLTWLVTASDRYRDARCERTRDRYEEGLRWRPQRSPQGAATTSRR